MQEMLALTNILTTVLFENLLNSSQIEGDVEHNHLSRGNPRNSTEVVWTVRCYPGIRNHSFHREPARRGTRRHEHRPVHRIQTCLRSSWANPIHWN